MGGMLLRLLAAGGPRPWAGATVFPHPEGCGNTVVLFTRRRRILLHRHVVASPVCPSSPPVRCSVASALARSSRRTCRICVPRSVPRCTVLVPISTCRAAIRACRFLTAAVRCLFPAVLFTAPAVVGFTPTKSALDRFPGFLVESRTALGCGCRGSRAPARGCALL